MGNGASRSGNKRIRAEQPSQFQPQPQQLASYATMPAVAIASQENLREDVPSQHINIEAYNTSSLVLKGNGLTDLPPHIFQFNDLLALDISENRLESLPKELGRLQKLRRLGLGSNFLTRIPDAIGDLRSLVWLDFTHNRVAFVSERLAELAELSSLGASDCRLAVFPLAITRLANLRKLGLFNNFITQLPPQIGNLTKLTKLDLSGNGLRTLPPEIGRLYNLTWLNLSHNGLEELPSELGELVSLRELGLAYNRLRTLPNLSRLRSLTLLPVYNNHLESVGPWIGELVSLTKLDLSCNHLAKLPSSIFRLPNLAFLNVRRNQLQEIPPINAADLTVRHKTLASIDVRSNQLMILPLSLLGPALQELKCLDNPFQPNVCRIYRVPALLHLCLREFLEIDNAQMETISAQLTLHDARKKAQRCEFCLKLFVGNPVGHLEYRHATDRPSTPFFVHLCSPRCRKAFEKAQIAIKTR